MRLVSVCMHTSSSLSTQFSTATLCQHRYTPSSEPYVQSDGIAQSVMMAGPSGLQRPPPASSVLSTTSNCSNSTTATSSGVHQHHHNHQQHHSHLGASIMATQNPIQVIHHHQHQHYDESTVSDCGDGQDGRQQALPSVQSMFNFTGMAATQQQQPASPATSTTDGVASITRRASGAGADGVMVSSRTASMSSTATNTTTMDLATLDDLGGWLADMNNNGTWSEGS